MWKKDAKRNISLFLKIGLPYTAIGMVIVLGGLWGARVLFAGSTWLSWIQIGWLALFWFIYQPLFRRAVQKWKAANVGRR